jgi:hypothetical protein
MGAQPLNIKRECTHGGKHRHGTTEAYKRDRCRCAECRTARVAEAAHRRRQLAYGRWQPFVDAEPVRQHVRVLMAQGMGWQRIAGAAGVATSSMQRLLYVTSGRPAPSRKIRADSAAAILAVSAQPLFVSEVGSQRRLQALLAIGWPITHLAERLGEKPQMTALLIKGRGGQVRTARAARIAALYDGLWDMPPAIPARTRTQLAWDDDDIDDPAAEPYRSQGGPTPWELKPCGTTAAARRHHRRGEPLCIACRRAVSRANGYKAQRVAS